MNWGKGVVFGMIAFMLFILTLCFFMVTAPEDDYDHQYYEKGLTFNHDYNSEVQVYKDHAKPLIHTGKDNLTLTFSQPVTRGTVTLSRPSDYKMDKIFALKCDAENEVIVPLKQIAEGHWQLVFSWESNHKNYLYQQGIYLK